MLQQRQPGNVEFSHSARPFFRGADCYRRKSREPGKKKRRRLLGVKARRCPGILNVKWARVQLLLAARCMHDLVSHKMTKILLLLYSYYSTSFAQRKRGSRGSNP